MLDKMMDAGIFGGIAAFVGFILAFVVLKLFKVSKPFEHKMFYPVFAAGMLFAYFMRSYAMSVLR